MAPILPQYVTDKELAAAGIALVQTLRRWRMERTGPPFIKINGSVRYDPAAVAAWIDAKTVRCDELPEPKYTKPIADILSDLERLAKLKAAGILTDDEVATLKARLMK